MPSFEDWQQFREDDKRRALERYEKIGYNRCKSEPGCVLTISHGGAHSSSPKRVGQTQAHQDNYGACPEKFRRLGNHREGLGCFACGGDV
jgi:hypothetical protein